MILNESFLDDYFYTNQHLLVWTQSSDFKYRYLTRIGLFATVELLPIY